MSRRRVIALASSGTVWLVLLGVWWLLSALNTDPGTLWPSPPRVLSTLWDGRSAYWENAEATIREALAGFLGGVALALAVGLVSERFRSVSGALQRLAVAVYSLPLIALAPILVLWTGTGFTTKALIAGLACFFPVLINLTQALRTTDRNALELMRVSGASRWQSFWRLELPAALPSLFAAFTVAAPAAIVGALLAEWVGAERGLGIELLFSMQNYDIAQLDGTLIVISALSLLSWTFFTLLGRRLFPWHPSLRSIVVVEA